MRKFLEGLMGPKIDDIDWEGEFKVPLDFQNGVVNWALFLIGALLFGVGVIEFCIPVMFIGAVLFGILLGRTK